MPVLPDAPGTLETGSATPRLGWLRAPIWRAMASAPPPVPHVQMKSIGRDGYFSWAATALTKRTNTARTTGKARMAHLLLFLAADLEVEGTPITVPGTASITMTALRMCSSLPAGSTPRQMVAHEPFVRAAAIIGGLGWRAAHRSFDEWRTEQCD